MHIPENLLNKEERSRRAVRRRTQRQEERRETTTSAPPLADVVAERRPLLLVGMLVVMIVAGVLLAGRSTVQRQSRATAPDVRKKAMRDLTSLRIALERFRWDCKRYPMTREGLHALIHDRDYIGWRGVYVSRLSPDPWQQPYAYKSDGQDLTLLSLGPDGQRSTTDDVVPPPPTLEQVVGGSNYWQIRHPMPTNDAIRNTAGGTVSN